MCRFLVLLAVALAALAPLPAAADEGPRLAITSLDASAFPDVRVVASVMDAAGRPLRGLGATDVVLTENGVERPAAVALTSSTAPVAIALAFDVSGSMAGKALEDAKRASNSLVRALGPQDAAALVTFNASVRVTAPLTTDKSAVLAATDAAVAAGDTAIRDALLVALDQLAGAPQPRRAIVLLTDGFDTASRTSQDSALLRVAEAGFPLYVVALGPSLDLRVLGSLASASAGGRLFEAPSSADLRRIYDELAVQLRTDYSFEYRSLLLLPAGAPIDVGLVLRPAGTAVATASTRFVVPFGRGTAPVAAAPAPTAALVTVTAREVAPLVPAPPRIPSELVGLLGAATVLTLLLWVADLLTRFPDRQRRRLEMFVRRLTLTSPEHAKRRSLVQRVIVPSLRRASRPLLRITPIGFVASTRERLQHAGEPFGLGAVEFIGVRTGAALVGAVLGLGAVTIASGEALSVFIGGGLGAFLGWMAPAFALGRSARTRQNAIRKALPSSLDMLALGAHAGLSFDGAIAQVAHRWRNPLSDEFRRVLLEFQMGRERRQALRELAARTGLPDVARFANAVVQAEALGVPLAQVLREQANELRTRRRQRAEELARKAPVKMLFPMVLLIFPALFVVILGPAVPRILEIFAVR